MKKVVSANDRKTIKIDPAVHRRADLAATRIGVPLYVLAEEALRVTVDRIEYLPPDSTIDEMVVRAAYEASPKDEPYNLFAIRAYSNAGTIPLPSIEYDKQEHPAPPPEDTSWAKNWSPAGDKPGERTQPVLVPESVPKAEQGTGVSCDQSDILIALAGSPWVKELIAAVRGEVQAVGHELLAARNAAAHGAGSPRRLKELAREAEAGARNSDKLARQPGKSRLGGSRNRKRVG